MGLGVDAVQVRKSTQTFKPRLLQRERIHVEPR